MTVVQRKLSEVGGDYPISPHFTLKEMACKDRSDVVLYSTALMAKLEELRAYVGGTVAITSGYRTASYNKKIGGASLSQHIRGTAADVRVKKDGEFVSAKLLCCLGQSLGFRGVGYISDTAVHLDMRESGSYRGDERKGYGANVGGDFFRYFGVSRAAVNALRAAAPPAKGEDHLTEAEFNARIEKYFSQRAEKAPGPWSTEARKRGEALGLFSGDNHQKLNYKAFCTREELAVIAIRLYDLLKAEITKEHPDN